MTKIELTFLEIMTREVPLIRKALSSIATDVAKEKASLAKDLIKNTQDLEKQVEWYESFTDFINEVDYKKYNQACEVADEATDNVFKIENEAEKL